MNSRISDDSPLVVGVSGASGSVIAAKLIEALIQNNVKVSLIASHASRIVWKQEMEESFGEFLERIMETGKVTNYHIGDIQAPLASGTYPTRGMVIVPCSMATVAALAMGLADNLLRRAADVCFKERRPLTIIPRETPLSQLHLENLSKLGYGCEHNTSSASILSKAEEFGRRSGFFGSEDIACLWDNRCFAR